MNVYKWLTRILLMLLTAVFGFFFGILAPLSLMGIEAEGLSDNPVLIVWLIFGILGYFVPCVLSNLGLRKISACFAVAGTCIVLYMHTTLRVVAPDAGFMYLPQMFVTVLTVAYAVIYALVESKPKPEQIAPSILDD